MVEALLLSAVGALVGFVVGIAGSWGIRLAFPDLQAYPPLWAMLLAVSVTLATGLLFSLLPARRAARLDPVRALQGR